MQVQNPTGIVNPFSTSTVPSDTQSHDSKEPSFQEGLKQLNDWIHETPEQRMEDSILASMGLTRQQFEEMSGPEKEKIAEKVRETVKKELRAQAEQAHTLASIKGAAVAASATNVLDASL
ncbi:hypothetical protein [Paraburkholderia sp. 22B1P]|uniref:hypothetical protein n=1 Tax=Paraburkholderia sp. 22B1P TaxID=3080498 RepID=UPI00308F16CA|nr:hypothetical protein PBP221_76440 [Paraburkholderia sp. 22B1P]